MAQTLTTVPGVSYQRSFWVFPRPRGSLADNLVQVAWDGTVLDRLSLAALDPAQSGASTLLRWWSPPLRRASPSDVGNSNSCGAYLDLVSFTQLETLYDVCLLYDPLNP